MQRHAVNFRDKFTRVEILFFIVYFLLFNILTDIEFNFSERHNATLFIKDVPERLVYGLLNMIPFWVCYKVLIQGYLFKKKYVRFLLLYLAYLTLLNFYTLFNYWLISKLTFIPLTVTSNAHRYFNAPVFIHFSFIYMFRELLVVVSLAYFIRSARQEKQVNELKQQQLQAELHNLKVQMQPHFFFNTLNNIYSLALQQSELTAPLVAKHAEMMQYVLYPSSAGIVKLQQEVNFLKNYVEVEKVRYAEKIAISFDEQGICSDTLIEPLLLLPFIENAFKHGISEEVDKGFVRVVVYLAGNELTLEVKNSKPSNKHKVYQNGIGLENVGKRLSLLYPEEFSLNVSQDDLTYEVRLTLKLKRND